MRDKGREEGRVGRRDEGGREGGGNFVKFLFLFLSPRSSPMFTT